MMSSRFYTIVAAAAGAGVLFSLGIVLGLGLLSAPQKIQADGTSPYLARVEGASDRARRVEEDRRVLSPIYPSSPKVAGDESAPAPQAATTDGSAREKEPLTQTKQALTQSAAKPEAAAPPPQAAQQTNQEAQAVAATTAPIPASTPGANATPIPNASANSCDVSACAAAYRSFRESDCSYQPFDGPRRLCVNPPAQTQASVPVRQPQANTVAAPPRGSNLDEIADEVRRLTRDDGVYPPPSMRDGSRVIVIERE